MARAPMGLRLIKEFTTFFSLILLVTAGLAFFAEWSDPGQNMAKETLIKYDSVIAKKPSAASAAWREAKQSMAHATSRAYGSPRPCGTRDDGLVQCFAKVGYAIVILVSGLFSFWQEYRVEQTLAALRKLLPQQAQVLRDDTVTQVPAEQLVPGDTSIWSRATRSPHTAG